MTAMMVRTLPDGEELVVTGSHGLSSRVEGTPREGSFRRRSVAISDATPSGGFVAGVAPPPAPPREAR
jgi:hypothetical protein